MPGSVFTFKAKAITFLSLIFLGRAILCYVLHRSGFESLAADDFGRVVTAAVWSENPRWLTHGTSLPFYTYFIGTALMIHRDLFWVPHLFAFGFGLLSIGAMFFLTFALFNSFTISAIAGLLLSVNPAHVWLSSTPLSEIMQAAVLFVSLGILFRAKSFSAEFLGAAFLGIAATIRFEAWIFAFAAGLYWSVRACSSRPHNVRVSLRRLFCLLAAVWTFPLFWIGSNYFMTGDPFFFATANRAFDARWYGAGKSFLPYFSTLMSLDGISAALSGFVLAFCVTQKRSSEARLYAALILFSFLLFAALQRGQVQPSGNYVRYLALFSFLLYPVIAWALVGGTTRFVSGGTAKLVGSGLCLLWIGAVQMRTVFQFRNDPAAAGLRVGQKIQALEKTKTAKRFIVERHSYEYLAVLVGADLSRAIVFDRPLQNNSPVHSPSLLNDERALSALIEQHQASYLVLKSPELQELAESRLRNSQADTVNGYKFYPLD